MHKVLYSDNESTGKRVDIYFLVISPPSGVFFFGHNMAVATNFKSCVTRTDWTVDLSPSFSAMIE
jgi:hypothetical protein